MQRPRENGENRPRAEKRKEHTMEYQIEGAPLPVVIC